LGPEPRTRTRLVPVGLFGFCPEWDPHAPG